jgi:hypothetical protein
MTASRIPGLDALRGLAALLVLAFHARGLTLPREVLGHGYLAVDLFFVISGFVLARAYDTGLAAGEGAGLHAQAPQAALSDGAAGPATRRGNLAGQRQGSGLDASAAVLGLAFVPFTAVATSSR